MDNKLCIHCSQNPPCTYQDGIFCRVTPCMRDNPGSTPFGNTCGGGDGNQFAGGDFGDIFNSLFGKKPQ